MNAPEVRIATGSVYHPPAEPYPRLLVMRRWPRGVAKGAVDQWERDLGPSDELLDGYQAGAVPWEEFERRYRAEIAARTSLLDWATRMATGTGVTLLCGSHPDDQCHRTILAALIRERASEGSRGERGARSR
ncbi:MAG: DUF488 family protein [Chloroflexi bacterium]|nr:DUF488 family protein [Chloroflexota bacterium]